MRRATVKTSKYADVYSLGRALHFPKSFEIQHFRKQYETQMIFMDECSGFDNHPLIANLSVIECK